MDIKNILVLFGILLCFSCSESNTITESENLKEYLITNNTKALDKVIACAASKNAMTTISYVFYYPIPGATNIQYFETANTLVDKDNYELYTPLELEKETVFNGYLERFVRKSDTESWCIVTYETKGKINVSNPIKLKNATKPTEWTSAAIINMEASLMPQFSWEDGVIQENAIYFQVVSTSEDDLLSGTYTYDRWFQFYKLNNVVLNITDETLPVLNINQKYSFTMMGVSEDNWVNLVLQKTFIAQ